MAGEWQGGFVGLVAPMGLDEFRQQVQGRRAQHFPGDPSRFEGVFDWRSLERLLAMTHLWSEQTMNLVLDGRAVAAEEYTVASTSREGVTLALADMARVDDLLARGATLVLDRIETLIPELAPIVRALASAFGASVVCNLYCSWQSHQGFPSHYDTTDVFALHIAGVKRWRIYEGRAVNPSPLAGHQFADHDAEHHARARGALMTEVELTPGDVLYLPRGQYHDALASSDASLHLSFGITRATGVDFMSVLGASLPDDDLMRGEFPHFDDHQATRRHLQMLAARLAELVADPQLADQTAMWQRERVFRHRASALQLPERGRETWVRVRHAHVARETSDGSTRLEVDGHDAIVLDVRALALYDWMRARELFVASDLLNVHGLDEQAARSLLDRFAAGGLIEGL